MNAWRQTSSRRIWISVAAAAVIQFGVSALVGGEVLGHTAGLVIQLLTVWALIIWLGTIATRQIGGLASSLERREDAHRVTLSQMEQLEAQNDVLQVIARAPDVTLAFQALARHIARMVPCDRMGLALLREDGQQFQTFTARVTEEERRNRPRPELEFSVDRTLIGAVVRTCEPMTIPDISEMAVDYLDANVLHSAGFGSGIVLPLISKGRAVGTINVVSRARNAFTELHAKTLWPIAEILAVAYVAQQLQVSLGRYRMMEAMAELTLSTANDINGALQTIIGHCDLLEREHPDPALQRDLATIIRQAQRIADLLDRMRQAATERLKETAASVGNEGIPESPEALPIRNQTT
jgi:transcriptional regulator with GAF, ATPase, and Fis domain